MYQGWQHQHRLNDLNQYPAPLLVVTLVWSGVTSMLLKSSGELNYVDAVFYCRFLPSRGAQGSQAQKTMWLFWKSVFSESIQNYSRPLKHVSKLVLGMLNTLIMTTMLLLMMIVQTLLVRLPAPIERLCLHLLLLQVARLPTVRINIIHNLIKFILIWFNLS